MPVKVRHLQPGSLFPTMVVIFVVLLTLQLSNTINISWWLVTLPLYLWLVLFAIIGILYVASLIVLLVSSAAAWIYLKGRKWLRKLQKRNTAENVSES